MIKNIKISLFQILATIAHKQKRYTNAVMWLTRAAKLGSSYAQNKLGVWYAEGNLVTQDHTEAVKWYTAAAKQGDKYAQANIAWAFYSGRGVTQSYELAFAWYMKAAEQGHPESQYNLGNEVYPI